MNQQYVVFESGDIGFLTEGIQGPPGSLSGEAAADIDMAGYVIKNVDIISFSTEFDNGLSGATKTIHLINAIKQKIVINSNTTITIDPTAAGLSNYQLRIIQDSAGGHTVGFSGLDSSRWLGSVDAPSANAAPNGESLLGIFFDGVKMIQGLTKVGAA